MNGYFRYAGPATGDSLKANCRGVVRRVLVCLALMLPGGARANTVLATTHVTAATIYPEGALVVREVSFAAPAGAHEVLITDLPADRVAELLRVSSGDVDLGAFALRGDRLPPREDAIRPEMQAAKDAVAAAKLALYGAEARVAGINAGIEAEEAQIRFLGGIKVDGAGATVESLSQVGQMIGTGVLAARTAALAAGAALPEAGGGSGQGRGTGGAGRGCGGGTFASGSGLCGAVGGGECQGWRGASGGDALRRGCSVGRGV